MITRLLIAAALIGVGALLFVLFNRYQRRRATMAVKQQSEGSDGAQLDVAGPRILYFRSDGCTSCETQARLLQQLDAPTLSLIERIDVDAEQELARAYNVLTLPTTLVIDAAGEVKHINYGVVSPRRLRRQVAEVVATEEAAHTAVGNLDTAVKSGG